MQALRLGIVSIACVALSLTGSSATAAASRTNLLLIVSDDHSADVLGAYGNRLARTPNLDRLAADGIRFDRAFCNTPICTPSRGSFFTGRYPHAVGVTLLQQALSSDALTLAERLADAGYRTGVFGKTHFNSKERHGFEVMLGEHEWRQHDAKTARPELPTDVDVLGPWRPFADPARVWLNGFHRPYPRYEEQMPGTWYAQKAIEFMRENRERPWFVQIGFTEPHSPFHFPVDLRDLYNPADMRVPRPGPNDGPQVPKIFTDLTHADRQGIIASYYTSVAFLDRNVGRVLTALDELKLADNTLVVYLGDNGYHLGEHGRFEKHTLYERCVRVPLIMRLPGRIPEGSVSRALVELVDVVPTVLDYLGVPAIPSAAPPRDLHGYSLEPLIAGRIASVRDAVFSEYQHTERAMVRTERWKLVYRTARAPTDWYEPVEPPTGRGFELYDLLNDPEEMHDLSGAPDPDIVEDLLDRLATWYTRFPPAGPPCPHPMTREDFLDWAIAPRTLPDSQPAQ